MAHAGGISSTAEATDAGPALGLGASLAGYRTQLREAVSRAVTGVGPEIEPIVSYHLGRRDAEGRPTEGDDGKGLRGCLALLSAELVGGSAHAGVPGAVAVELVHNFSLLHDDIIDLDRERRHRPTAWTVFGLGPTIVAGDALLTLAVDLLLEQGGAAAREAVSTLLAATGRMIDGQAVDLSYQVRRDITAEDVLEMSARKTGALIGCAASIGAVLAGADPAACAALQQFGLSLGIAFQAVDDILGTWGDPEVTGKDVGSDMRRRKLTLPLAVALSGEGAEAEELRAIMAIPGDLEPWHVNRAIRLVEECGGRDWTVQQAKREFDSAIAALDSVGGSEQAADLLRRIAVFSVARAY